MTASNARVVLATLLVIALAVIAPLTVSAQEATLSSLLVKLAPGLSPDAQAAVIARNGGVETSAILALRLHVVAVLTADLPRVMANYQADPQVQHVELNAARSGAKFERPCFPGGGGRSARVHSVTWPRVTAAVHPPGRSPDRPGPPSVQSFDERRPT